MPVTYEVILLDARSKGHTTSDIAYLSKTDAEKIYYDNKDIEKLLKVLEHDIIESLCGSIKPKDYKTIIKRIKGNFGRVKEGL